MTTLSDKTKLIRYRRLLKMLRKYEDRICPCCGDRYSGDEEVERCVQCFENANSEVGVRLIPMTEKAIMKAFR